MPNRSEPMAWATSTASSVRSVSAPGWSTREFTGSRMKSTSEPLSRATASPYMSMITWWFRCRFMPGKPTPDASTMRGQASRRACSTATSSPSCAGARSVPGKVKPIRGPAIIEVSCTPVSASAFARESRSLSVENHISTASKPAAAAARTRSPASSPASLNSSSMLAESWYTSGVLAGEGGRDRPADEVVLLADEVDRVRLVEVGEGVALPLAGEEAGVAAADELPDDRRVVDRRLVAVLVDVVELGVHVLDLRHDVGPLGRVDVPVHVEGQPRERAEALGSDAAGVQVLDELPVPGVDVGVGRPDPLQPVQLLGAQTHLPELAQDRRRHAVHGRAEVGDEAQPLGADLLVGLADLHHPGRVRAERGVQLPAHRQVELVGHRQQPADERGLGALDAHQREAEGVRAAELGDGELVLLVRRHVAVAPAAHVEVAAERAGHEAVPVEGLAPVADELVGHLGIGADRLRGDDLDAGPDARGVDDIEQAGQVVPAGGPLAGQRVEGQPELDVAAGHGGLGSAGGCGDGHRGSPCATRERRLLAWLVTYFVGAICMYGSRRSTVTSTSTCSPSSTGRSSGTTTTSRSWMNQRTSHWSASSSTRKVRSPSSTRRSSVGISRPSTLTAMSLTLDSHRLRYQGTVSAIPRPSGRRSRLFSVRTVSPVAIRGSPSAARTCPGPSARGSWATSRRRGRVPRTPRAGRG